MRPVSRHLESHRSDRIGWLRAAVLGANDGILSVASLVVGVGAASQDRNEVLLAGVAGMVAGAMSMAAGEYVSVSSQADTEGADRRREQGELRDDPAGELDELTQIYVQRGLDEKLARQVAEQFMQRAPLETHLRDELGITEQMMARPLQAALASALSFSVGAILPLLVVWLAPLQVMILAVAAGTLLSLASLGGLAARAGGAPVWKAAGRVSFWGAVAMAATSAVGWLFSVSVQ